MTLWPDQGAQPERLRFIAQVNDMEIKTDSVAYWRRCLREKRSVGAAEDTFDPDDRIDIAGLDHLSVMVIAVTVAIPDQVQPGTGPNFDQHYRAAFGERRN